MQSVSQALDATRLMLANGTSRLLMPRTRCIWIHDSNVWQITIDAMSMLIHVLQIMS